MPLHSENCSEPQALHTTVQQLAQALTERGWMMATAESCTGGMIAAACTDLPGSSRWFDRGFVTYSNAAKTEMLGVPAELIEKHGAVSEEVARAMAEGAAQRAGVQVAVAVTGIAGPDGGTKDKPVGTVWLAFFSNGLTASHCLHLGGSRTSIRQCTSIQALRAVLSAMPVTVNQ